MSFFCHESAVSLLLTREKIVPSQYIYHRRLPSSVSNQNILFYFLVNDDFCLIAISFTKMFSFSPVSFFFLYVSFYELLFFLFPACALTFLFFFLKRNHQKKLCVIFLCTMIFFSISIE
jgi:hypothetical protein